MGKKDFNKGMEAGAKPFEERFEDMSKQNKEIGDKLSEKIDDIGNIIDVVVDELSDIQRKDLYHLNAQYDLREDLDEDEKELLAALLLCISKFAVNNEYQQQFVRSVNQYIGIINPQEGLDIACIENIENLNSQKILMQIVMEYLYLEKLNFNFMDDYEEVFECFNVNRKRTEQIKRYIENEYHAVGAKGIAEKYGLVIEEQTLGCTENVSKWLEYDGSDISEACADKINVHHHYIVLNDYIVYVEEQYFKDSEVFCVHKQTGKEVKMNLDILEDKTNVKPCNFCGYGDTVFLLHQSILYRATTRDFVFQKADIKKMKGIPRREYFPQCNDNYLVYFASKDFPEGNNIEILVVIDLHTKKCEEILPEEKFRGIEGFRLVGKFIYMCDSGVDSIIYKYNLLTKEKIKIADGGFDFMRPEEYHNDSTMQYGGFIFTPTDTDSFSHREECMCNCLDLENDKYTSIILNKTWWSATFVSYHYVYYLKIDSSIGRYDLLTGRYENIIDSSDTTDYYKTGLIRKKMVKYVRSKMKIQLQIVGKWLYYQGVHTELTLENWNTPPIHKIYLEEENRKDVVLQVEKE